MKIESVNAICVNIPLETPYFWSAGIYPGTTKVIVIVKTNEGITGIGEAASYECENIINKEMGQKLLDADPFDLEECERLCVPETQILKNTDSNIPLMAFGGIEMALWDIRGKAWNLPLYKLLGGAVRKEITFTEYYSLRMKNDKGQGESSPAEVASYCNRAREQYGSTMFEGKCSTGSISLDVKIISEIRNAIGNDVFLRLDGNMAWSLNSAKRLLYEIEKYDISNFEEPVKDFYEMQKLRQHSRIPFSTHTPDLKLANKLGAPDAFVLNLTLLGGIARTSRFIAACEEIGLDFWFYSGDTGVASAAYLHVAAATRHVFLPSQSLFRFQADDVIEEGPFKPKNNIINVPEGPGLGITLSHKALKRCHQRYIDEGVYNQYYNPFDPKRYIRLPLC